MSIGGLTAKQSEALRGCFSISQTSWCCSTTGIERYCRFSRDVAIFTKDGGENLLEAAVAARQLGINIDSVAKSARCIEF